MNMLLILLAVMLLGNMNKNNSAGSNNSFNPLESFVNFFGGGARTDNGNSSGCNANSNNFEAKNSSGGGGIFDNLSGLFGGNGGDKTGVILELLSNPLVLEILKNLLFKEKPKQSDEQKNSDDQSDNSTSSRQAKPTEEQEVETDALVPTVMEAKQFFKPVEKVAGVEISKELYDLYDNWYITKKAH